MNILLQSTDGASCLELLDVQPGREDFGCTMSVKSRGFTGQQRFYFNTAMLRQFCEDLTMLQPTTFQSRQADMSIVTHSDPVRAVLKEGYEPDQLSVWQDERLGVCVAGRLTQHGPPRQELQFSLVTSEAAIEGFRRDLRRCLDAAER